MTQPTPCILFTAFEPSGDEHAAPVIAALRLLRPDVPIFALGGRRMAEAGATLIETTTDQSVMLAGALGQVMEHKRRLARLREWVRLNPVALHVPTDSPAANWSICKMIKSQSPASPAKVAHLVAPQVWAWASWRVGRLQRWSDLVLCLLPFEPTWFARFGVKSKFIGHPLFDHGLDDEGLGWQAVSYPGGYPRLALLPGSRMGEIRKNWPVMLRVAKEMRKRYPELQAVVAAADERGSRLVNELSPGLPAHIKVVHGQTDAVLHWSQVVLTVSGTASLHVARHARPMAILYRVNPLLWHLIGRWLIKSRTFTLPNLISLGQPAQSDERHIVKEFVPFWGSADPIVRELSDLLENSPRRLKQLEELAKVVQQFRGHQAGQEAAQAIADLLPPPGAIKPVTQ